MFPSLHSRARASRSSGHTLMELMVVVFLLVVAATILLPITAHAYARFRLRLMQDSLVRLMHEAKTRSLLEGRPYFLVFPDSGTHRRPILLLREDGTTLGKYTPPLDMFIFSRLQDGSWSPDVGCVSFYPDGTSDSLDLMLRNASNSVSGIRLDPLTARTTVVLESGLQP